MLVGIMGGSPLEAWVKAEQEDIQVVIEYSVYLNYTVLLKVTLGNVVYG
jgi:hypothetical protein